MGRIIGYQYDDNVQDGDAWIGSEDGGGRTKQYTAEAVANYLNIQGKISIVGQMTYKYGITPLSGPGTFAVFGGGTDPVAFSAITKLTLSNTDVSKQRVVEFLNLLVGSDILISKQSAISTFGYYSIDNYAVNATDPAYYDLGVTFKSGNGSMEAEQIYETQNFTLAAEENISTLQTTIDAGNTYASGSSLWQWEPDQISQVDPDEGWGLVLSPEEGVIFTDGVGGSAGRSHLQATNLKIGNLTYTGSMLATNLTANRNFQLPNNSGTLALTTDITPSPWDTVTGGINYANGNVGIGTTTPSAKLDVNGDALINGLTVGQGAGTSIYGNTVFGKTALDSITTGLRNVAIGSEALLDNTVGNYNIALGYRSLENNSANNNVAIGVEALQRVETAGNNTAVGRYTLALTSGANNTAIGYGAGYLRVGGTNGNSIDSVFIGSLTTSNGLTSVNEIVIGTSAISAGSNTVVLGNDLITSTRLKGDVIVANGNVGIGTTSPGAKLDVAGTGKFTGQVTIPATPVATTDAASKSYVDAQVGTADTLSEVLALGNTSGTNDISMLLGQIIYFNNDGENIRSIVNGDLELNSRTDLRIKANNNSTAGVGLEFWNGGSEKMRVNSDGNVGIGTTSPGAKLDVDGTAYLRDAVYTNNLRGYLNSTLNTTLTQLALSNNFGITGGNVGIGKTNPATKLDVRGDITIANANGANPTDAGSLYFTEAAGVWGSTQYGFRINQQGASNYLNFQSASTTTVRDILTLARDTGNVGIGTTSPSFKLEVAGNAKVSSNFYIGNVDAVTTATEVLVRQSDRVRGITPANLINASGGPYLPLSAGSSYPLTGDLYMPGFIYHVGDTDSYFGFGSPNVFDLATGGSRKLYADSTALYLYHSGSQRLRTTSAGITVTGEGIFTGNVGIGTTSPSQKLSLELSDTGTTQATFKGMVLSNSDTTVNNGSAISFSHTAASSNSHAKIGAIYEDRTGGSEDTSLFFGTLGGGAYGERMRITSTGNVGIGTTDPGAKLHISDDSVNQLYLERTGAITGKYRIGIAGATNRFHITDITQSSDRFVINENGNVGIGTTSPGAPLSVVGNINNSNILELTTGNSSETANNKYQDIAFEHNSFGVIANTASIRSTMRGGYRGDLRFLVKDTTLTEAMSIEYGGNVGIGTTSPQSKLHLATTGSSTLTIQNTTNSGNAALNFRDEGNNDQFQIYYALGANRSYNLVNGNGLTIYSSQSSSEIARFGNASSGYTDSYFTGNVGIGTTSPTSRLDVAGGDIELDDAAAGIIMRSPDGTKYRITVANGGTLTVTAV